METPFKKGDLITMRDQRDGFGKIFIYLGLISKGNCNFHGREYLKVINVKLGRIEERAYYYGQVDLHWKKYQKKITRFKDTTYK